VKINKPKPEFYSQFAKIGQSLERFNGTLLFAPLGTGFIAFVDPTLRLIYSRIKFFEPISI
jgi:hypothetical protein